MISTITSSVSGNHTFTKDKTSVSTTRRSFQDILSENYGYDISKLSTTQKNGNNTSGGTVDPAYSMMIGKENLDLDSVPLILPTLENLYEMKSQLNEKLADLLYASGIESDPPFDINIDYSTNRIEVSGDRGDIEEIEQILNDNPEINSMIHTVLAIGSHVINFEESLAFQEEYLESNNPESVVAKYSHLFDDNRKMHSFSLRFDGELQALSDGRVWVPIHV